MKKLNELSKSDLLLIFQALSDPIRLDIFLCLLKSKEKTLLWHNLQYLQIYHVTPH